MTPNENDVIDVAAVFGQCFTPTATAEAIKDAIALLPLIENADTAAAEQAAIDAWNQRPRHPPTKFDILFRGLLQELCNYPATARRAMLNAALAMATTGADASRRLRDMVPEVLAAFQKLDNRTKAILVVLEELHAVHGTTNLDYGGTIPDQLTGVDVEALRQEPDLAPIMQAYDLARIIHAGQLHVRG
jgi:hypothetical protein